jgi:hypothetical protein
LGMFKDTDIILRAIRWSFFFYQISNKSNVYLSSSRFWTATSRYLPPAPFHLEIENTT